VFLAFFLLSRTYASAQVVVNEFSVQDSPDWVELYNYGVSDIDLSFYKIKDEKENVLNLTGIIKAGEFITFDWSNRLNNDGDILWLIKTENSVDNIVEEIRYGEKGGVCSSDPSGSIGKTSDGGNTVERFLNHTKGKSNEKSQLNPCPTPTQLPTDTPRPTSTPKPTQTSFPTSKPTATPSTTLIQEVKSAETAEPATVFQNDEQETFGIFTNSPTPSEEGVVVNDKQKHPFVAFVFIGLGIAFIGTSASLFLRSKKNDYNGKDYLNEK